MLFWVFGEVIDSLKFVMNVVDVLGDRWTQGFLQIRTITVLKVLKFNKFVTGDGNICKLDHCTLGLINRDECEKTY